MTDTTTEVIPDDTRSSAVSWGAVIAGGLVTAALMLLLLALGTGIGLSAVSPWSHSGFRTTHAATGAGIYLMLAAIIASAVGGYVAGRLRRRWLGWTSTKSISAIRRTASLPGHSRPC